MRSIALDTHRAESGPTLHPPKTRPLDGPDKRTHGPTPHDVDRVIVKLVVRDMGIKNIRNSLRKAHKDTNSPIGHTTTTM